MRRALTLLAAVALLSNALPASASPIIGGADRVPIEALDRGNAPYGDEALDQETALGSALFLQRDPSGYRDSVNLYAALKNDPINHRDPTGRAESPCSGLEGDELSKCEAALASAPSVEPKLPSAEEAAKLLRAKDNTAQMPKLKPGSMNAIRILTPKEKREQKLRMAFLAAQVVLAWKAPAVASEEVAVIETEAATGEAALIQSEVVTGEATVIESEAALSGEGTTLYRAVGGDELADLEALGRYRVPPGGVEGKYFFRTPEQASNFARMMRDQPYTTTSVDVSPAELSRAQAINPAGEGPGYFFSTPDVPSGPVTIWDYSVVPR